MNDDLSLLKDCLENRSPILYVGAGFTFKSENQNGISMPLASELCKEIYKHFWNNSKEPSRNERLEKCKQIAKQNAESGNLKEICQILRLQNLLKERNAYLTDFFFGCNIPSSDVRNVICEYPWDKIFTVNIDDLIENIYSSNSKLLNVWNRNNDDKKHHADYPTLIKLHGCVNNPEEGYVFDSKEYTSLSATEDYIMSEFGDAFSKNDIIFIGTEFQEDDLQHIIEKYTNMGYNGDSVNHYYFITPQINNEIMKMRIETSDNMHHIAITAVEFFEFIKKEIQVVDEMHNRLIEMGLMNVYDIYKKIPSSYSSDLYSGKDITYADLKYNWDCSESNEDLIEWSKSDTHNKIISFFGKDYVGKTCKARRLLYDFFVRGYDCYEFNLNSSDRIELFINYVNSRGKDVAVLFEGAAYQYELLVTMIINQNISNNRIILITSDVLTNHNRKYHALLRNIYCKMIPVKETINQERAELIYNKLDEKHSLSRLLDKSSIKEDLIEFIKDSNDIIDVLYYSSLGRSFEEHIKTYILSDICQDGIVKKQIGIFSMLGNMGMTYVPPRLFLLASKNICGEFKMSKFKDNFAKMLQINKEYYHLRYSRLLLSSYLDELTKDEKFSIIISLIKNIAGRFNEGDYNEHSSILYKLLNLKSLRNIFSYADIKKIYLKIEDKCNQYSYFWVQRGLCAQKQNSPDYEEADRFLREARRIRPNSYQVTHAIAKNLIERGLNSDCDNISDSNFFSEGMLQMKNLIENERFSRAFSYSLHAYIDSWLRYCDLTRDVLKDDECFLINSYVETIEGSTIDPMLCNVLIRLKKYAKRNNLSVILKSVTKNYWKVSNSLNDLLDECSENDWIN